MRFLVFALAMIVAPLARAAPAPAWVVDKAASSIRFSSSFNGAAFSGGFGRWDADIHFDPANLAGSSVTATIDVASASTGDADRDQTLPSDKFFSAAKFPRATFAAHAFKALGGNRYQAIGQLTMRGVSRPLALPFTLVIAGGRAHMNAEVALDRLAFGVGQDEWRATTSLPAQVRVDVSLTAQRR
ncbi:MAG TPA: YceI family protein [Caulobacteraceae bacterium]|jgi:polyisoprenoid-binding protein YceI